jgi:hypothetical protein
MSHRHSEITLAQNLLLTSKIVLAQTVFLTLHIILTQNSFNLANHINATFVSNFTIHTSLTLQNKNCFATNKKGFEKVNLKD